MKKVLLHTLVASSLILAASTSLTFASENPVTQSSNGSENIALGGSQLSSATVQSAASAVAVPLIVSGSAGVASTVAGSQIINSTSAYEPLEITEKTITRGPTPAEAMK